MRNLIIIISLVFVIFKVGIAREKAQITKKPGIILQLDTTTLKFNDTIIIDSKRLVKIKSFIYDSTNYKMEIESLIGEISSLKQESKNNKAFVIWIKFLLYPIAALVLALLVFLIIDKKNRKDEILIVLTGRKSDKETSRLSEWTNAIIEKASEKASEKAKQKQTDDSKTHSIKSELELTIKDLQNRIAMLEDSNKTLPEEVSSQVEEQHKAVSSVPSSKTLYAEAIVNNMLHKITEQPNDDTVFELFLKTPVDKTAGLMIYIDAYKRVLKNADFIDGCEKQKINKSPINLEVEKGEAQLQDNGKWQVTKKANVKFV